MSLQVVAVANGYPKEPYLQRGYEAFLKSARKFDFDPVILGWGQPWRGLGSKPKLLRKAMLDGTVHSEHIIFADAYDVFFASDPRQILNLFDDFPPAEIVWNAERNCFPRADWADHHPPAQSSFKFFNSGLSVGKRQAYLDIFNQMDVDNRPYDFQRQDGSWHHENDQGWLMEKFLFGQCGDHEPVMKLDTGCRMFLNMVMVEPDDMQIGEGMAVCKETETQPLAFHFAGGAKTAGLMEPILKAFNL
jgi:hypothetical protein